MNKDRLSLLPVLLNKYSSKFSVCVETGTVKGLTVSMSDKGYYYVSFWHDKKAFKYKVHELVAFLGGMELLDKTVNHIDGDKLNNRLDNLETLTSLDNHKHAKRSGLLPKGSTQAGSKLTESQVSEIKSMLTGRWGENTEIAKKYGIDPSVISKIKHGKDWKHV